MESEQRRIVPNRFDGNRFPLLPANNDPADQRTERSSGNASQEPVRLPVRPIPAVCRIRYGREARPIGAFLHRSRPKLAYFCTGKGVDPATLGVEVYAQDSMRFTIVPGTLIKGAVTLAITLAPGLAGRPASAGVVAGTAMPDTIRIDQHVLMLNGVAVYSKFGVQVLVAGLWLDHRERDAGKILGADLPRRYVTHFLRHVSSKRVRGAWMKGLEANSPGATAQVREQFRILCSWTRNFLPGDEITVTYVPGRGSLVDINRVRKGVFIGKGFADAYFACAIGPRPGPGEKFKRHLLGA